MRPKPHASPGPRNIDEYIGMFPPDVQIVLETIRSTIKRAAPEAEETISYKMPAFRLHGMLVYFAAFKNHIGMYPPVNGDPKLDKELAVFAGEKGNLKFPLDRPVPYELIARIVNLRVKQDMSKAAARKKQ